MPSTRAHTALTPRLLPPGSKVVVRATTGLEQVLVSEIAETGHTVEAVSKRQLIVSPANASLLSHPPRLADDLFLLAAEAPDPGVTRAALSRVAEALHFEGPQLALTTPTVFAVSASFIGRRNYSRFDIEDAIGRRLSRQGIGSYFSRRDGARPPHGAAQWRITLDGTTMRLGVRPFAAPLHRRPWRTRTVVGSVHPPVAAAMARLANIQDHHVVLDPCCGAGTVLLEAHAQRPAATFAGRDIDSRAIAAAEHNGSGLRISWSLGDAGNTQEAPGTVDRIIVNPPWGVRRHAGDLEGFLSEWHRIMHPNGLLVALLDESQEPALAADPSWRLASTYPLSLAGRHPRIFLARPNTIR
ncbi:methyltransferase domain-containing protein [Nesterenkonia haasae]|uniref:methyltransferase domain-containing protein n=1 Tax=Nesterenkonia haasae TaxID=2587813 RepID=UPI001390E565|nr:methyltransferase domain-containing protein [Nesterenkonia haasae]NDK30437.1 methyltransferase domain-containing protein [Nesterenkonia haasae]